MVGVLGFATDQPSPLHFDMLGGTEPLPRYSPQHPSHPTSHSLLEITIRGETLRDTEHHFVSSTCLLVFVYV